LPSHNRYKKPASLLIVNNPLDEDFTLKKYIRPGVYKITDGKIQFVKEAYSIDALRGEDQLLILSRFGEGDAVEPGKRILKIMKLGKSMKKGELNQKAEEAVLAVKKHFKLPN
jgi:hypothetical protein